MADAGEGKPVVWQYLTGYQNRLNADDWDKVKAEWKHIARSIEDRLRKPAGYAG
jgi:hypothetical protein